MRFRTCLSVTPRILVTVALALLLAAMLAACKDSSASPMTDSAPGTAAVAGVQTGSITVKGMERSYRLYVPRSLPADGAAALVIGMHGGLGTPEQFAENSR